jgi:hypothetical protein
MRLASTCRLHPDWLPNTPPRPPSSGYGCVLPQESLTLTATFQPPIPGVQFFELCCRTTAGRVFRLEGKACGLVPAVALSHNVVKVCASVGGWLGVGVSDVHRLLSVLHCPPGAAAAALAHAVSCHRRRRQQQRVGGGA